MAKRILIYTNHFFPENFKVNEIAAVLKDEQFDVTVITGTPNYPSGRIYEGYGVYKKRQNYLENIKVRRLPLIPRGSGSKFRLILNYLSYFLSCFMYTLYISFFKKKYDVVFVHHTSPILIAFPPIVYKWIKGAKLILWDLDMWPDTLVAMKIIKSDRLIKVLESLVSWVYRQYNHVLVGSRSFMEKAETRISKEKVSYFPNWAERVFTDSANNQSSLDIDFPKGFKVMYAGNIGEAQDFDSVAKAMNLLKDEPIEWLIVGDGRRRQWLENELTQNNLMDKVHFYGSHDLELMPFFFSKADLLFFSLRDEEIFSKTVPAKLQAYMASSKPVIGMISGEGNTLIKDSKCGISVNSGDYEAFSRAVKTLSVESEERLKSYSCEGKAYYETHFSLKSRRQQLLNILNDKI